MDKVQVRQKFYDEYLSKVLTLYKYQLEDYLSGERVVVIEKSRQVGYSWCMSLRCLVDALLFGERWYIFSINKDEAKNKIDYARMFITRLSELGFDCGIRSDNRYEIVFNNNGIISSLSYRSGRGYNGNILVDEFLWIPNDAFDNLMKAIRPLILRGNSVMRLVSSSSYTEHVGYSNKKNINWRYIYWWNCPDFVKKEFVNNNETIIPDDILSLSTIDRVYRYGSDALIDLFEDYGNTIDFAREFECYSEWSPDIIFDINTLSESIDEDIDNYRFEGVIGASKLTAFLKNISNKYYVGYDVGRRRNSSELVFINVENKSVDFLLTLNNMRLEEQELITSNLLDTGCIQRLCIDSGGIGLDLSERLVKQYRNIVEPIVFTNDLKVQLVRHFSKMLGSFRIPNDLDLLSHIIDLRISLTSANNIIYKSKTKKHNNDMFWALCLALRYFDNFSSEAFSSFLPVMHSNDLVPRMEIKQIERLFGSYWNYIR